MASPRKESRFANIETAPPDAILNTALAFKADTDPRKVNLGIGAYRDLHGQPMVLESVKMADAQILADTISRTDNKEYVLIEPKTKRKKNFCNCSFIFFLFWGSHRRQPQLKTAHSKIIIWWSQPQNRLRPSPLRHWFFACFRGVCQHEVGWEAERSGWVSGYVGNFFGINKNWKKFETS